jgi:hypothetical protein
VAGDAPLRGEGIPNLVFEARRQLVTDGRA